MLFLKIWLGRGFILSYLKCVYVAGGGVFYFSLAVLAIYLTCGKWVMSVHNQASKTPTHSCRNSPRKRQISVPHQAVIRLSVF